MRENRLHGSEGGVAKAIPTPIHVMPNVIVARDPALREQRLAARRAARPRERGLLGEKRRRLHEERG